jgi:hypothetical protein
VAARQDHGCAGRAGGVDDASRDVDPARRHGVQREPAEWIVADDAEERDAKSEASGAAGDDRRRAADRHDDRVDDAFDLPEDRHGVVVRDDQVGIDLADDEEIDVAFDRVTP